jgi:type IV secretory pathway VirB10-like protein
VVDGNGKGISSANIRMKGTRWESNLIQTDTEGFAVVNTVRADVKLTITASKMIGDEHVSANYSKSVTLSAGDNINLDTCIVLKKKSFVPDLREENNASKVKADKEKDDLKKKNEQLEKEKLEKDKADKEKADLAKEKSDLAKEKADLEKEKARLAKEKADKEKADKEKTDKEKADKEEVKKEDDNTTKEDDNQTRA